VSSNALEASALTERAHSGAAVGAEAVRATIKDIEQISALTNEAKDRLGGLVSRVCKIGNILAAIDEINDETKLLSLNAAIIAAQAGEQGKAFLIVANHVKTLSQRTAGSTHDIETLIADIEAESTGAVRAMEAGIEAVAKGVERSRDAGEALANPFNRPVAMPVNGWAKSLARRPNSRAARRASLNRPRRPRPRSNRSPSLSASSGERARRCSRVPNARSKPVVMSIAPRMNSARPAVRSPSPSLILRRW
jgi:methyl-accepting chemotaxis protein